MLSRSLVAQERSTLNPHGGQTEKKKIGCQRSLWVHLHRNCKRRLIGSMAQGKDLCIHISTEQENVRYQQPAESAHYPKSWYYCQRSFGCVVCPGQERLQMQPMNNKIWCIKFGANNGASGLSVFFLRERERGWAALHRSLVSRATFPDGVSS